jgi:hypothetical protein
VYEEGLREIPVAHDLGRAFAQQLVLQAALQESTAQRG